MRFLLGPAKLPLPETIVTNSLTIKNLINEFNIKDDYVLEFDFLNIDKEDLEEIVTLLTEDIYCDNFRLMIKAFKLAEWLEFNIDKLEERVLDFFVSLRKNYYRQQLRILKEENYSMFSLEKLFKTMRISEETVTAFFEFFYPNLDKSKAIKIFDKDEFTFRKRSQWRTVVTKFNNKKEELDIKVLVTKHYDDYKEWIVNLGPTLYYLDQYGQLNQMGTYGWFAAGKFYRKLFNGNRCLILENLAGNIIGLRKNVNILPNDIVGKLEYAAPLSDNFTIIITKDQEKNLFWILENNSIKELHVPDDLKNAEIVYFDTKVHFCFFKIKEGRSVKNVFYVLENNNLIIPSFNPFIKSNNFDWLGPEKYAIKKEINHFLLTSAGSLYEKRNKEYRSCTEMFEFKKDNETGMFLIFL